MDNLKSAALLLTGLLLGFALNVSCSGGSVDPAGTEEAANLSRSGGPTSTSAFGIPDGLTGTVSDGETLFNNNCAVCHGTMGPRTFDQIKSALSSVGAMRSLSLTDQEIANITAYLNRDSIPPSTDPPPATDPPPSTEPGGSPPDTTTDFGTPAGLSGSISAGEGVWTANCAGCHSSMSPKTLQRIEAALSSVGAMRSLSLSQQEIADLTAYLNLAEIQGQPGGGTMGSGEDDDDDGSGDDEDDDSFDDDDGFGSGDDDGGDDSSLDSGDDDESDDGDDEEEDDEHDGGDDDGEDDD